MFSSVVGKAYPECKSCLSANIIPGVFGNVCTKLQRFVIDNDARGSHTLKPTPTRVIYSFGVACTMFSRPKKRPKTGWGGQNVPYFANTLMDVLHQSAAPASRFRCTSLLLHGSVVVPFVCFFCLDSVAVSEIRIISFDSHSLISSNVASAVLERARTAREIQAQPLWREAAAQSIEDRLRARTPAPAPGPLALPACTTRAPRYNISADVHVYDEYLYLLVSTDFKLRFPSHH
ncbi:hypothetical protein DFJ58DRAFT_842429 [Suillus subalutaceus]|uniref:uncharacterized protein n=1 Tax=Suillus subalutaceus TaxID=48586 RepID=UPI001B86A6F4|nr:uncharacterized protein DFJ58DRAFT_842429 [Suillus subalutaceus]KAG1850351.1 hypothetical protein DFJ58DRAFT_842429 [Suillus subalutaceus]